MGYTGESNQTPGKPRQATKIIVSSSNNKEIELISRHLKLNRLSLRLIAEYKAENLQTLHAQSCPQKSKFGTFLSVASPLLRAPPKE